MFSRSFRLPCLVASMALCAACSARAEPWLWTNVRVAVYEDRRAGALLGCSEQHIREHVYARMIHRALDSDGSWLFVVGGQSTVDKIVISVDILARRSDRPSIASVVEHGLSTKPSAELLASEARLVAIEDNAISARPDLGDRLLWQIAPVVAPGALIDCKGQRAPQATVADLRWEAGRYQLAFFDRQELPEIRPDPRHEGIPLEIRGVFDFSKPAPSSAVASARVSGGALFVGLAGRQTAEDHIRAVAQIYGAAREVSAPPPQIRAFGIGGFVVFGDPEALRKLSDRLAGEPSLSTDSLLDDGSRLSSARWAHGFVCSLPSGGYSTVGAWADAVVLHPYFAFWTGAAACADRDGWLSKPVAAAPQALLYRQFLSTGSVAGNVYKVGNVKYSFCFKGRQNGSAAEAIERKTFFDALRQYFRMDVGLSIDIRERDEKGPCSTIGFIAPAEHHDELVKQVESFRPEAPTFMKRLRAAEMEYHCGRRDSRCDGGASMTGAQGGRGGPVVTLKKL